MGMILAFAGGMGVIGTLLGFWASRALECPHCGRAPADARPEPR